MVTPEMLSAAILRYVRDHSSTDVPCTCEEEKTALVKSCENPEIAAFMLADCQAAVVKCFEFAGMPLPELIHLAGVRLGLSLAETLKKINQEEELKRIFEKS